MSRSTDPSVQRIVEHAATTRVLDIVASLDAPAPAFRRVCQFRGTVAAHPHSSDAVPPKTVVSERPAPTSSPLVGAGHLTNNP